MKRLEALPTQNHALVQDERWALAQKVGSSNLFQKSPKLREFLLYVCESALRNNLDDVREQQIGSHVFNRRPDYNMGEDSIVRVQARELRKRLAAYFATEGSGEPVVILIPKGGYVPLFVPRDDIHELPFAEHEPDADGDDHPDPGSPALKPYQRWFLFVLAGLLLFAIGWVAATLTLPKARETLAATPPRQSYFFYDQLLGSMGQNGQNALVVLSNPRLILYSGRREVPPAELRTRKAIPVPPALGKLLAPARNIGEETDEPAYISILDDAYTGIGEAACAFNVGRLMLSLNRSVRLTEGRFLNWDSAKQEQLIVLGNPDINNWTHQNVSTHNFVFTENGIRNSAPLPGEEPIYNMKEDETGSTTEDFGIIRMSTTVSGARVLVLAGRTGPGTQGAGDFFTNPEKMKLAFNKLSALNHGKQFPANWEVLIRISVRDNIPVNTDIVASRVNDPPR